MPDRPKALKWWAILTLGPYWTFRVLVVPGSTPDLAPKAELAPGSETDGIAPGKTPETAVQEFPETPGNALPTIDVEETFDSVSLAVRPDGRLPRRLERGAFPEHYSPAA